MASWLTEAAGSREESAGADKSSHPTAAAAGGGAAGSEELEVVKGAERQGCGRQPASDTSAAQLTAPENAACDPLGANPTCRLGTSSFSTAQAGQAVTLPDSRTTAEPKWATTEHGEAGGGKLVVAGAALLVPPPPPPVDADSPPEVEMDLLLPAEVAAASISHLAYLLSPTRLDSPPPL